MDEDRFEGIAERMDGEEEADADEDTEASPAEPAEEQPSETDAVEESEDTQETAESDPLTTPAFEYTAVQQRPLYPRDETWTKLEDVLDIEVVPKLRQAGVRDIEQRELHDAALRVAAENPNELIEEVRDSRGVESNDD